MSQSGDRDKRELRHVRLSCDRWYGTDGDFRREKYIFPIDEVRMISAHEVAMRLTPPRAKEEKNRLDIFHKFILVARDNNFFSAPLDVKQALRVLDLGTGTGIWAIELSEKYPHMIVQGLDFNMIQPEMIPPTMNPPQPFDIEDSWDTIDRDWDFIRAQMLFGSIQCWREMYQKMFMHLKPGIGYMEQVEIDWVPRCDDGTLPTDSALDEWTSKLLKSLDRHGRSMRVDPDETRRQLALAGFTDIDEAVIKEGAKQACVARTTTAEAFGPLLILDIGILRVMLSHCNR
ncbi:hypothetical protein B0J13DRAFT_630835 [Dactylonectria estremocensis]|uniref:Methyltransferase n=1 Tax=Dactylonectria estremocensis TaxID=1079267 RepID=A0A9P9D876_9HYPO|nr:hypothetical protein B0J13DRAFT_630835 [Dactylonectria estremocensis]